MTTQSERAHVFNKHVSKHLRNFSTASMFFSHYVLYFAAVMIGIARYSRDFPVQLTLLMVIWSIGLSLHGLKTRQLERDAPENSSRRTKDVLNVVVISSLLNTALWVMWTLATDGVDASPWHLGAMLTTLTGLIVAGVFGKQALFEHWSREYHNRLDVTEDGKLKRDDLSEASFDIGDDGEIASMNQSEFTTQTVGKSRKN